MQTELINPGPLLAADGRPAQVGWSRQPLLDANLENARFYALRPLQRPADAAKGGVTELAAGGTGQPAIQPPQPLVDVESVGRKPEVPDIAYVNRFLALHLPVPFPPPQTVV